MRLATVREFALSLPEAGEAPHFHFNSFRVRGKMFVTVPPGEEVIHVFVPEAIREPILAAHPDFIEKLLWGGKVVGLRIVLRQATPAVVKRLVRLAWEHKAPKALRMKRVR
ncbi:MAG: MmcQ/YjbR family DNA-binding protein [Nevskia sp.]|nr:MmcQ/YjbR family DNA-binding protein [Nevskia sp.]